MILGASGRRWSSWRDSNPTALPDVYVRVVPRTAGPVVEGHPGYVGGLDLQQLPGGLYFRGGFTGPAQVAAGTGRRLQMGSAPMASRRLTWWQRRGRSK